MVISSILVRTFISSKCLYKVIRKAFTEMSTTLFWTLFVILIGVICLELLILVKKINPWFVYWDMRSDSEQRLMDLERR